MHVGKSKDIGKLRKCRGCSLENFMGLIYIREVDITQEYYARTSVADNEYRDDSVTVLEYKLTIRRTLYHTDAASRRTDFRSFLGSFVRANIRLH